MSNIVFNQKMKYKEICKMMLDEEVKDTRARKRQLAKWNKQYEIVKDGTWYEIVRELTEEEKSITYNSGKYSKHIEDFLILFLSRASLAGQDFIVLTNRNILEGASMVNSSYFKGMNNPHEYNDCFQLPFHDEDIEPLITEEYKKKCGCSESPIEKFIQDQITLEKKIFFSASYRLLKRLIYDALVMFEKQALLLKAKTFVCYRNYTDEDGQRICESFYVEDDMIKRILTVQNTAMRLFNTHLEDLDRYKPRNQRRKLTEVDQFYLLTYQERQDYRDLINKLFRKEFANEGFTGFSSAWRINLAKAVSYKFELQSRHLDWRTLNDAVANKLLQAKDLSSISLNEDFVNKFIKTSIQGTTDIPNKYKE